MTREEHLMVIAMEECNETAHRLSKALRFGMDQVQQDVDDAPEENPDKLSNRQRVRHEFLQLIAVMEMLEFDVFDPTFLTPDDIETTVEKARKVERYLLRSAKCGTLNG